MSNTDWDIKAAFMREHGAVEATWAPDDKLVSLKLGAEPAPDESKQTHRPLTPEEQVSQMRERKRLAVAASGRPVARGEVDS